MKTYQPNYKKFYAYLVFILFVIVLVWIKIHSLKARIIIISVFIGWFVWSWASDRLVTLIRIDLYNRKMYLSTATLYVFFKRTVEFDLTELTAYYYDTIHPKGLKVKMFIVESKSEEKYEINPILEEWFYRDLDNVIEILNA